MQRLSGTVAECETRPEFLSLAHPFANRGHTRILRLSIKFPELLRRLKPPRLECEQGEFAMPKTISYAQWSLEPYCLGMKLRALRNQKRLTLSRLAAETGLSTALLSKLETDRMIPTLTTLATISRVYGVGMSHFFKEPERHTLSITRKAHLQANSRPADAERCIPLNCPMEKPRLVAQMIEMAAGAGRTDAVGRWWNARNSRNGRLRLHRESAANDNECGWEAALPCARRKARCREVLVPACGTGNRLPCLASICTMSCYSRKLIRCDRT